MPHSSLEAKVAKKQRSDLLFSTAHNGTLSPEDKKGQATQPGPNRFRSLLVAVHRSSVM
jgi:hypothetical protein